MSVKFSAKTAEAFSQLGLGHFTTVELPERMAWIVRVLRLLDDRPEWFPAGKWATIQYIEGQLSALARTAAEQINLGEKT